MSLPVILRRSAEREIVLAATEYAAIAGSSGQRFLRDTERTLDSISHFPLLGNVDHACFRKRRIRRFPHAIYYVVADNAVIVYGIIHLARDPATIRRILRDRFDL